MQEFPLPTRADAVGLFCFCLHQHFYHGGCIFLFFNFCFIGLGFVVLFVFCNFVWCFIFQDYFLCNPSQPLQPFIAPLRGKSLWRVWKETSSVRISFLVFKFSPQFFSKVYENLKRDIINQNLFLGFQVFTSKFFWKVYEKREKEHHQKDFLSWFSSFQLKLFWKVYENLKRNIISQNFFLGFQVFTSTFFF